MSGRRLALVISSLGMGGAERVLCQLAGGWVEQDVEVTIITISGSESDFYPVPDGANRIALDLLAPSNNSLEAIRNNFNRLKQLRKALSKIRPHAVISFMDATNVLAIWAAAGLGSSVVVSERIDLEGHQHKLPFAWRAMRQITYPRAAAIVAVTQAIADQVKKISPRNLVLSIPNPVPAYKSSKPEMVLKTPCVIGMGRLVPRKGFDLLLRAFARCRRDRTDWNLVVLGDGPERQNLEAMSFQLGLDDCLFLPGSVAEPMPVLAQADIFALCSSYEGFPNSLNEAMSCGLPVVCSNYAGGPGEIISQGREGLLFKPGDEDALAECLAELMDKQSLRDRMGSAAKESAARYALPNVMEQWNDLLTRTTGLNWQ